jgi:hypothetical protein
MPWVGWMDGWIDGPPTIQAASIHFVEHGCSSSTPNISGHPWAHPCRWNIYLSSFGIVGALGDQGCGVPSILSGAPLGMAAPRVLRFSGTNNCYLSSSPPVGHPVTYNNPSSITASVFPENKNKNTMCQMNIFLLCAWIFLDRYRLIERSKSGGNSPPHTTGKEKK